jgi:hypothetical protein
VALTFGELLSLANSAYLASAASTLELQHSILDHSHALSDSHADDYTTVSSYELGPPPSLPAARNNKLEINRRSKLT